jgi:EcsC family protein
MVRAVSEGMEMEAVGGVPDPVWKRVVSEPERAPEILALAAAERFAEPAERWVQIAGQGTSPAKLARTAFRKHVHLSRAEGLVLGFGGALTSAANLGALGWIQARMVFYIAAANGYDPRHPMRPAELLALWGVYETPAEARASLDGMGPSMAATVVQTQLSRTQERNLSSKLVRYVGKRVAKRYAGRLLPVIGAPISAIQNGGSTKELGRRAMEYYGGRET